MSGNRQASLGRAIKVLGGKREAQQVRPMPTKLTDKTYYIAFLANGMAGTQALVDSNLKKVVGITNFDGSTLAEGRELVMDGVRVLYTKTAATGLGDADWGDKTTLPAAFQGAEFRLLQGDVLIDLPLTDMQGHKEDDFRSISTTPVLRAKQEFKMELEFPKGVTATKPTTGDHYIRIEFRVTEAKK